MNVSLDDRTAQKTLWLSEGGAKVSRMSEEVCPVLDRPERYEHSPQVYKCPYLSLHDILCLMYCMHKTKMHIFL